MNEYKKTQTNPYSSQSNLQPKPVSKPTIARKPLNSQPAPQPKPTPVAAAPAPAPAPMPEPQPVAAVPVELPETPQTVPEPEPVATAPAPQPTTPQTPPASTEANKEEKSNAKKYTQLALVIGGFLFLVGAISGGTWFYQQRKLASVQSELEQSKQDVANLKVNLLGGEGGTVDLLGGGDDDQDVAGAQSTNFSDAIYSGQIGKKDKEYLFEAFIDTSRLPKLEAVWVNWGGSAESLDQKSPPISEDLDGKDNEVSVVIVKAKEADFTPGSSYLYQISARDVDGNVHSSGYSVMTIPGAASDNNNQNDNADQQQQNNNQQNNQQPNQPVNPFDLNL